MTDLTLKVEAFGGCDCRDIIRQMCALATHMRVGVECELNGVKVRAVPYCDAAALGEAWFASMNGTDKFKYVSGSRFTGLRSVETQTEN